MGMRLLAIVGAILVLFAPAVLAEEASGTPGLQDFLPLIILIVVFGGIFYFMLIRPQRKRQAQMTSLIESLKRGDSVITAGGIHGEIDSIGDTSVVLTLEDDSKLRMAKSSIVRKAEK